ncbi:MAG: hypothetical protein KatS3mg060_1642 [Dehalococcoidia bacterium]|nr:MAG: hypothetical protein KatS3mg060_1642 [Dehalococcoidia bacterium]
MLAVDRQRERGAAALRSVLLQPRIDACEVLLFDFGRDRFPPLPGSEHPAVRDIPMRVGWTIGTLRAYAIALARAPIVAFLEEHSRAEPGWLDAILAAFNSDVDGVGGVPSLANPESAIAQLAFLINFRPYLGIDRPVERTVLPGFNSAYRRSVLLGLSSTVLESETTLDAAILRAGGRLVLDPAMRWLHTNETSIFEVIQGLFVWARTTGSVMAAAYGWPFPRRLLRIARTLFTPVVRLAKLLWVVRRSPEQRSLVLRQAVLFLLAEYAQAVGIAIGLLLGPGDAPRRYLDFDLNARRGW